MAKKSRPGSALLLLDMLSEYQFPDADKVLRQVRAPAKAIARLKHRASAAKIPVIYVNDTAGKWESDQQEFIRRCCSEDAKGRDVSILLAPAKNDYFMFKPRHSGFYGTPLHSLLERLRVTRLILTSMTGHQCVLFTAMDAHVRGFELIVPRDCLGGSSRDEAGHALFIVESALEARTGLSSSLRL